MMSVREDDIWHIVVNKYAGPRGVAEALVHSLTKLLSDNDVDYSIHETQSASDGVRLARTIVRGCGLPMSKVVIAVCGGDGTVHDLVNGVMSLEGDATTRGIRLVILPAGTANAVYHSYFPETASNLDSYDKLLSAKAALQSDISPVPLSICRVFTNSQNPPTYSHVVTSTCLHADILETASTAEMRERFPGVDRFKKAAEQHLGTAYSAKITLRPIMNHIGGVQKWSHTTSQWHEVAKDDLVFEDEFAYFISSLVDRFEAAFRIAPLSSPKHGRPAEAVDILLVRYKKGASRDENAQRLVRVLMGAYEDGKHIKLLEESKEGGVESDNDAVVEYYRTGGFEWQPLNESARLVCLDGATSELEPGQVLKSEVTLGGGAGEESSAFSLFC